MILRWPEATWNPGPPQKAGYALPWPYGGYRAPKQGEVKHSAEGYWPGVYSRLLGPDRASWHVTIGFDRSEQHYEIDVNCWHAGDVDDDGGIRANIGLVGVEHLGLVGQPLVPYQVAATKRLTAFLSEQFGRPVLARYPAIGAGIWTLAEHNQVSDDPTGCPSKRIPWDQLIGGGDMFHRMNGVASFFSGRRYEPGEYPMHLGVDFPALSPAAHAVELDVRIDPSTLGSVTFRDGADGAYADQLSRYRPHDIVRVIPDATQGRDVRFVIEGGAVTFRLVGIVGWWG